MIDELDLKKQDCFGHDDVFFQIYGFNYYWTPDEKYKQPQYQIQSSLKSLARDGGLKIVESGGIRFTKYSRVKGFKYDHSKQDNVTVYTYQNKKNKNISGN